MAFSSHSVNRHAICGDNVHDPEEEECEDGNLNSRDGCDNKCDKEPLEVEDITLSLSAYSDPVDIAVLFDIDTGANYCCGTLFIDSYSDLTANPSMSGLPGTLVQKGEVIQYHVGTPSAYNFPLGDTVVTFQYTAKNQFGTESTKVVTVNGKCFCPLGMSFICWAWIPYLSPFSVLLQ